MCYLLDGMIVAREKEITPEDGEKYLTFCCDFCGVAECHEDVKVDGNRHKD